MLFQVLLQLVAAFGADGIHIIRLGITGGRQRRRDHRQTLQPFFVQGGHFLARVGPVGQVAQFYAQNGGLDFVHAQGGAFQIIFIRLVFGAAAVAQAAAAVGDVVVIGGYGAGVPACAEVFAGIKTKRARVADTAYLHAVCGG